MAAGEQSTLGARRAVPAWLAYALAQAVGAVVFFGLPDGVLRAALLVLLNAVTVVALVASARRSAAPSPSSNAP